MSYQTEYSFTLPDGYVDEQGTLHKRGKMRLATAADEIIPLGDPRVKQNPEYLTILLLSRVIVQLDNLEHIDARLIEKLSETDLNFLNDMYDQINRIEDCTLSECFNSWE